MFFNTLYIVIFALLFPFFLLKICISTHFRKIFFYRLRASFSVPQVFSSHTLCDKNWIWIHAASVGEVDLVRLLQEKWQAPYFITTNTLGGLTQAKKFNPHSFIAPLDFSWSIKNWFKKIKIKGLVLIEAEIWYNTISLAAKKCPVALVNGRVQKKDGLNHYANRMLYQKLFTQFSLILASNQSSYDFYCSLGKDKKQKTENNKPKIAYSGNLKFASSSIGQTIGKLNLSSHHPIKTASRTASSTASRTASSTASSKKKNSATKTGAKLFLAASLQPEELPIILDAYFLAKQKIPSLYLALIPRHLEKTSLFLKQLPKKTQLITKHPLKSCFFENSAQKILFIPLLGVLKDWYANADSVFVGGSLCARGGQNIIEPLSFGVPTATGYNTKNFEFAMELFLPVASICKVNNAAELSDFIVQSLQKPASFQKGLALAQKIITEQNSSLSYTVKELKDIYRDLC